MQIQFRNQVQFKGLQSFRTPEEKALIVNNLKSRGVGYVINDESKIITGKDLTNYKNQKIVDAKKAISLEVFESGVKKIITEFRNNKGPKKF